MPVPAPKYNNPAMIVEETVLKNNFESGIFRAYKAAASRAKKIPFLCIKCPFSSINYAMIWKRKKTYKNTEMSEIGEFYGTSKRNFESKDYESFL